MAPAPLRPAQTWLIVVASFLVAGALWPWADRLRLMCSAGAVAAIVVALLLRMRAHAAAAPRDDVPRDLAARMRAERAQRMGPRR